MRHIDVDDELDGVRPECGGEIEIQPWCISVTVWGLGELTRIAGLVGAAQPAIATAGKIRTLASITESKGDGGAQHIDFNQADFRSYVRGSDCVSLYVSAWSRQVAMLFAQWVSIDFLRLGITVHSF